MISLIAALFVSCSAAHAADIQPAPGSRSCFRRSYTQAHMHDNPKQALRRLAVLLDNVPPSKSIEYGYRTARVVGERGGRLFGNLASCEYKPDGSVFCSIECDGGSFTLQPESSGATFRVTPDYYFPLFRRGSNPESPQDSDILSLDGNDHDNNLYWLFPAKASDCLKEWQKYKKVPELGC